MLPIDETSATAEPVTPPKNIEATQTICARLPGSHPTSTSAMRTSRLATPPRAISVPAKTKKITASSGKVFSDVSMRCTMVALSTPGSSSVATSEAMPTENEIGTPSVISRMNTRPRMISVIASADPQSIEWPICDSCRPSSASTMLLTANSRRRAPEIGIAT